MSAIADSIWSRLFGGIDRAYRRAAEDAAAGRAPSRPERPPYGPPHALARPIIWLGRALLVTGFVYLLWPGHDQSLARLVLLAAGLLPVPFQVAQLAGILPAGFMGGNVSVRALRNRAVIYLVLVLVTFEHISWLAWPIVIMVVARITNPLVMEIMYRRELARINAGARPRYAPAGGEQRP